jgi:hypothetical protein
LQVVSDHKTSSKIGVIYKTSDRDRTLENWERVFGNKSMEFIEDKGIPVLDTTEIKSFWDRVNIFIEK